MKSILFISLMNGDSWGGSEEQWYQTAMWLCSNKIKVGVCVFDWEKKNQKLAALEKNGCTVYRLPQKGKGIVSTWRKQKILNAIPYNEYEYAYVNQGGWQEVTHGPFKKLYQKLPPYALSFHNYQLHSNLKAGKVSILASWIKQASVCIAATRIIFEMLENEYRIFAANKEISYSPMTFSPPANLPAKKNRTVTEPYIFVVLGALDVNRKAQDVLIKSFAHGVWKSRLWQLHIYGEGKDRNMLEALIIALQLEEKVFLKGHTGNVQQVLANTDMLIQATRIDAMPISVIEAMAMGVPCIVSNVGDMPYWVQPGYNGFIAPSVDVDMIGQTLETAWAKRTEWNLMGKNARETFIQKYPQPYEEKFVRLLESWFTKK